MPVPVPGQGISPAALPHSASPPGLLGDCGRPDPGYQMWPAFLEHREGKSYRAGAKPLALYLAGKRALPEE